MCAAWISEWKKDELPKCVKIDESTFSCLALHTLLKGLESVDRKACDAHVNNFGHADLGIYFVVLLQENVENQENQRVWFLIYNYFINFLYTKNRLRRLM